MDDCHKLYGMITKQFVSEDKYLLAHSLRREMTVAERVLWKHLRRNQIKGFHFRRQQIISGFIADFYSHKAALVIEADGQVHDADYDRERDKIIADNGITILRFSNKDILEHTSDVLNSIYAFLDKIPT